MEEQRKRHQGCTSWKKQIIHLRKVDGLATWIGEKRGGGRGKVKYNICKNNISATKFMTFNIK